MAGAVPGYGSVVRIVRGERRLRLLMEGRWRPLEASAAEDGVSGGSIGRGGMAVVGVVGLIAVRPPHL